MAQLVFKTSAVVQPTARSVRLRRRSVRPKPVNQAGLSPRTKRGRIAAARASVMPCECLESFAEKTRVLRVRGLVLRALHSISPRPCSPEVDDLTRAVSAFLLLVLAWLSPALAITGARGASAGAAPTSPPPHFGHALVVVLENKDASAIVGAATAPHFNNLARRYALLTNYNAVAHPSLPNYLALVSGTTGGLRSDCLDCTLAEPTIAQTLDAAGKPWKAYVEGVRRNGFGDIDRPAVKARIPFLFSPYVVSRPSDMKRMVPLHELAQDLRRGRLPAFSLLVPNLCHDMHDCSIQTGDRWLGSFAGRVLPALRPRDVVFVVFDEGDMDDLRGGGGQVAALVLGPVVRRGSAVGAELDHYSLLRTIEHGLGLPLLGRSALARPIVGIWR